MLHDDPASFDPVEIALVWLCTLGDADAPLAASGLVERLRRDAPDRLEWTRLITLIEHIALARRGDDERCAPCAQRHQRKH